MKLKKVIRGVLKTGILLLGVGVLLTSLIGGISIFRIVGTPGNIDVDHEDIAMNFGVLGNEFTLDMSINNDGYFAFENFSVQVECIMHNKSSTENLTLLDSFLYQNDLLAGLAYNITLNATESDFTPGNVLADNNGTWFDPDIQPYIDNGTITESDVELTSYPYLLWHYDVIYRLTVSSNYNLGLLWFGFAIEFTVSYDQFFTETYPNMKATIMGGLGL